MHFNALPLMPEIQKAIQELDYQTTTPIQAAAIPLALAHKDIMATAQTGTGKTAAFAIPIIQHVAKAKGNNKSDIKALILSPTRELAIQIEENIIAYAKYLPIKTEVIFGGVKQHAQVKSLNKGVDILVATPGRLLDLHGQGLLDISNVQYFVLDEADRMLDMGFINDIKRIIKIIPTKRQTLFFSATMAGNIQDLSKTMLTNPERVSVDPPSSTAEKVSQHLLYTNKSTKYELLKYVIKNWNIDQAIIFTRTKHGADKLAKNLNKDSLKAGALHGGKAQNNREKTLSDFKAGKVTFLIATDIAARGIDIEKLGYVINYEIPNESESYVHRIGRSGRAGEAGTAISLCEPEENTYVKDIEKLMKMSIPVTKENPYPQTDKPMNDAEKKEWRREQEEKKRAYFQSLREQKNGGSKPISHGEHRNDKPKHNKPHKDKTHSQAARPEKIDVSQASDHVKPFERKHKNKSNSNNNNKRNNGPRQSTDSKVLKDKYMWPLL